MDICISGDDTISRNDHAFVVYDPRKKIFRIQAGLSRGLVYLNGEEVIASELLAALRHNLDRAERASFHSFVRERFQWETEQES